mgnify:FL=1
MDETSKKTKLVIIGELINASRKSIRRAIEEVNIEAISEVARDQA